MAGGVAVKSGPPRRGRRPAISPWRDFRIVAQAGGGQWNAIQPDGALDRCAVALGPGRGNQCRGRPGALAQSLQHALQLERPVAAQRRGRSCGRPSPRLEATLAARSRALSASGRRLSMSTATTSTSAACPPPSITTASLPEAPAASVAPERSSAMMSRRGISKSPVIG